MQIWEIQDPDKPPSKGEVAIGCFLAVFFITAALVGFFGLFFGWP